LNKYYYYFKNTRQTAVKDRKRDNNIDNIRDIEKTQQSYDRIVIVTDRKANGKMRIII